MRLRSATAALALSTALLFAGCSDDNPSVPALQEHPTIDQFKSAATCGQCHPNHYAEWRGSMHAYAFVDPVRTKTAAAEMQATGGVLGPFCVGCHSPIALVTEVTDGTEDPSELPPLAQEGVTCEACHLERAFNPSDEAGGHPVLVPGDTIFGSFDDAMPTSAHESIRNPMFDRSISCMPCHDFIARGVPFEPTFTEWNESSYSVRLECQDCHMQKYSGQAAVGGPVRANLTRHDFIGVDVAMVPFPDREVQKAKVAELLRNSASLFVDLPTTATAGEAFVLQARVANDKTGHNLPSGVSFARQMWLEVVVRNAAGDTIYVSGSLDANGDLRDAHSELDPNGDPDLKVWTTEVSFDGAEPGITVFVATGISGEMIPPEETRGRDYSVPVPPGETGSLSVSVRLLFRGFKPYSLRGGGLANLVTENPIFEMNRFEAVVPVSG